MKCETFSLLLCLTPSAIESTNLVCWTRKVQMNVYVIHTEPAVLNEGDFLRRTNHSGCSFYLQFLDGNMYTLEWCTVSLSFSINYLVYYMITLGNLMSESWISNNFFLSWCIVMISFHISSGQMKFFKFNFKIK